MMTLMESMLDRLSLVELELFLVRLGLFGASVIMWFLVVMFTTLPL